MAYEIVVADALNTVAFQSSAAFSQTTLKSLFGISPSDLEELFNGVSKGRPDLLIGKIDRPLDHLVIPGSSIALSPRSSSLVRYVTVRLGLAACRRVLSDVLSDVWLTDLAEMSGGVPPTLFHGTSDSELQAIRRDGILTTGAPNWNRGISGTVSLAAEPQVAAMHALETSEKRGGRPIVIECKRPASLVADWDVINLIASSPSVPSNDEVSLSREAGLFATPNDVLPCDFVRVTEPRNRQSYQSWLAR